MESLGNEILNGTVAWIALLVLPWLLFRWLTGPAEARRARKQTRRDLRRQRRRRLASAVDHLLAATDVNRGFHHVGCQCSSACRARTDYFAHRDCGALRDHYYDDPGNATDAQASGYAG